MVRRSMARQISEKEQNSSVRRQPTVRWLNIMVRWWTARRFQLHAVPPSMEQSRNFSEATQRAPDKYRLCHRTPPELTKCPLTSPFEQITLKQLYVVSAPYLGVYLSVIHRRAQNKIHPHHGGPRAHTSSGFGPYLITYLHQFNLLLIAAPSD
jgi:hypothetical protein